MSWSPFPGGPVYATGPSGSASSASMASSGSSPSPASFSEGLSKISGITAANNAWSAQQASQLRDWQSSEAEKVRKYNAAEAEKNRSWQEYMSSSAHQREIEDLKKAGLNPVLSVLGGNGASTTSGATASSQAPSGAMGSTDFSGAQSLVGLLGSFLQQQTQLAQMNTSALTNLAVADKYTAMSKYTAELGASTQLHTTAMNNAVQRFVSQNNLTAAQAQAAASVAAATIHKQASMYSADRNYLTQTKVAEMNGEINRDLKKMGIDAQFDLSYNDYVEEFALKEAFGNTFLGKLAADVGLNSISMLGGDTAKNAIPDSYRIPRRGGFSK
nr:hypothetical protein BYUHJPPR_BYUHJPPR_CDS_0010 [Microvirus sp.]